MWKRIIFWSDTLVKIMVGDEILHLVLLLVERFVRSLSSFGHN